MKKTLSYIVTLFFSLAFALLFAVVIRLVRLGESMNALWLVLAAGYFFLLVSAGLTRFFNPVRVLALIRVIRPLASVQEMVMSFVGVRQSRNSFFARARRGLGPVDSAAFHGYPCTRPMRLASSIYLFFLFLSTIFFLSPLAYGAGDTFVFNNFEIVSRWNFENVQEARFTGNGLLLEGNNYMRISPPAGLRVPLRRGAMVLRFKTPKSLVSNISLRSADNRVVRKHIRVNVPEGSDKVTTLRVYFGKYRSKESYINDFAVEFFSVERISLRLDSIRLYEPSTMELASIFWEEFWRPDFITGSTVGFVTTPAAGGLGFMGMLYIFTAIVFAALFVFCRFTGQPLSPRKAARNLLLILLFAGVIFAVRMDYNWLTIWRGDVRTLSGADVGERVRIVHNRNLDSFLDFIDYVKRTVPSKRAVRPATRGHNEQLSYIARYYMLPVEDSREADLLWSYGDSLSFDQSTGALHDSNGRLIEPKVRVFAKYAENAVIYEVIK